MANLFTSQTPSLTDVNEVQPVTIGITIYFTAAGTVDGGRFYAPATIGAGTYELTFWQITADDSPAGTGTGTLLASATFGTLTAGAWNTVTFSSPVTITPNTVAYRIAVRTSQGRYTATGAFFNAAGLTNGSITAPQTGTDPVGIGNLDNGNFYDNSITLYPNKTFNGNVYFVDPTFSPASGNATVTASVVAAVAAVPAPTVKLSSAITPATVAAVAAVPAPTVRLSSAITPATVAAVAAVPAPTVRLSAAITPATVAAVAAVSAPTVTATSNATAIPATVVAVAAVGTPTVTTSGNATATPGTVAATATIGGVTITAVVRTSPATVAATAAVGTPTIVATMSAFVVAATVAARAAVGTPLVNPGTGGSAAADFMYVSGGRFLHVERAPRLIHVSR